MALTKYKLGELIQFCDDRNYDGKYSLENVKGISFQKLFIDTKANMEDVLLNPYILVKPDYFAYVTVTSRNGEKITLAHNTSNQTYIVSSSYVVFKVKDTGLLCSDYLFMYFNRQEFDRYARFYSYGSAREIFDWNTMCDIDIELPDIAIQQKYVNIYKSLVANQQSYERGLEDLKLVCDGCIEDLRKKMPCEPIGKYIVRHDIRNGKNGIKKVMGISTSKQFREPTSKVKKNELENYKICRPRQIAFVQTTHNEKVFAYAFNNTNHDIVISSVNEVFSTDENRLYPEFLCMFFNRSEFDRYARFYSWGSARETFTWSDLQAIHIPIPDIKTQQAIAAMYSVYVARKRINEQLKAQIKNICPILIRGSLEYGG